MTDIKTKLAEDQARWDALAAKAREMAAKEGPAAVAACEVALGAGEMVRRMVAAMLGKGGPVGAAERAWVALQTRKARAAAKARKAKAREERKRIRREAALSNAGVLYLRTEAIHWAEDLAKAREQRRQGLIPDGLVAVARRRARDSAIVYAAHCAAVGAVPEVEA